MAANRKNAYLNYFQCSENLIDKVKKNNVTDLIYDSRSLSCYDIKGNTLLMLAIEYGNIDIFNDLVEQSDINWQNLEGNTPLLFTYQYYDIGISKGYNFKMMEALRDLGADHYISNFNFHNLAYYLKRFDVDAYNEYFKKPLYHNEIIKYLNNQESLLNSYEKDIDFKFYRSKNKIENIIEMHKNLNKNFYGILAVPQHQSKNYHYVEYIYYENADQSNPFITTLNEEIALKKIKEICENKQKSIYDLFENNKMYIYTELLQNENEILSNTPYSSLSEYMVQCDSIGGLTKVIDTNKDTNNKFNNILKNSYFEYPISPYTNQTIFELYAQNNQCKTPFEISLTQDNCKLTELLFNNTQNSFKSYPGCVEIYPTKSEIFNSYLNDKMIYMNLSPCPALQKYKEIYLTKIKPKEEQDLKEWKEIGGNNDESYKNSFSSGNIINFQYLVVIGAIALEEII